MCWERASSCKSREEEAHRACRQLRKALRAAVAHDDEAQMTERVLVKEFSNEDHKDAGHGGCPVGPHVLD